MEDIEIDNIVYESSLYESSLRNIIYYNRCGKHITGIMRYFNIINNLGMNNRKKIRIGIIVYIILNKK